MNQFPPEGLESESTLTIYEKLQNAFVELGENIPLVLASLPKDVKVALSSTDNPDIIREIWFAYLERMTSYLGVPNRDEQNQFLEVHGHRYVHRTHEALTQV
ncbi:hypothetical protein KBC86_01810 [Candidatus Gracilibacteria bacterium]|nr:hypothetical protein [Candidatus Gracilibacteria bacterium]